MARTSLLRVGCPEEGWERWSLERHGECCLLRLGLRQEEPGGTGVGVLRWHALVLRAVDRGEGEVLTSVPQSHSG